MIAQPIFRGWTAICPFCQTKNTVSDGTGNIAQFTCSHYMWVCHGGRGLTDMVFQQGTQQK